MTLLPFALILLSILLSGLYNLSHQLCLSQTWRWRIITVHAVAIESIQLLLLLVATAVQYLQFISISRRDTFTLYGFRSPAWFAVPLTTAINIFAILAVDIADTKIQLRRWRHPVQIQTLLLTRSKLLPWTVKRRGQRNRSADPGHSVEIPRQMDLLHPTMSPRKVRSLSEPVTSTILQPAATPTRRGSLPQRGSVAKMVSKFENKPVRTESLLGLVDDNTS